MRERVEDMPGVAVLFTTPLGMRIDEGLGGTPADLSVRIFGPDLDELSRLAGAGRGADSRRRGHRRPARRAADRPAAAADRGRSRGHGARRPGAGRRHPRRARSAWSAKKQSQIWIGQRRFDLVVRLRDDRRDTFDAIRTLLIDGHDGRKIPLGQLADDHADVRSRRDSPRGRARAASRSKRRSADAISAARRPRCGAVLTDAS